MLSFLSKTLFENDHIFTYSSLIFKEIQQDLELRVFWFLKKCLLFQKPCIMRLAKTPKIRTFAKLLVKICVSQVFLDPIQNHVSARSAHLEAAYRKALL